MVGADKFAAVHQGRYFFFNGFEILSKMRESLPLSERNFVIDIRDPLDKLVVQLDSVHDNSALGRPTDIFSRHLGQAILPPVLETGQGDGGDVVPFVEISVFRLGFREFLYKSKDIGLKMMGFQLANEALWVFYDLTFGPDFIVNAGSFEPFAKGNNLQVINEDRWNPNWFSLSSDLKKTLCHGG